MACLLLLLLLLLQHASGLVATSEPRCDD